MDIPPAPQPQPQPQPEPQPGGDAAARFRKPEPAAAPAPAPAPAKKPLPPALWFALGALTASAGWYGYGLMQKAMIKSMAESISQQAVQPQMAELIRQTQEAAAAASGQPMPQTGSSLDLIGSPGGTAASGQPALPPIMIDKKQVEAVGKASADLVGSIMPMLNDPGMLQRMDPAQRQQALQLTAMMQQLQDSMKSGKPIDNKTRAEFLRAMQAVQQQAQQAQPRQAPRQDPQ